MGQQSVHVWDVRNDKIACFRQFADTAKFLEVVPAEVAATTWTRRLALEVTCPGPAHLALREGGAAGLSGCASRD